MRKCGLNKRGSVQDVPFIAVMMFVILFMAILGTWLLGVLNDAFTSSGSLSAQGQATFDEMEARHPKIFDNALLFVLIGVSMAAVIGAFAINTHPIFYFVSFIFLLFAGVANLFLKDLFFMLTTNTAFTAAAQQYTIGTYLMTAFPFIMAVISFMIAIITYSKFSTS